MSQVLIKYDSLPGYLKSISTICAYCGIALDENNKTIDHILPRASIGTSELHNMAVCCPECNTSKDILDIKTFLSEGNRLECFENYLKVMDFNINNLQYAEIVRSKIESSKYKCSKTRKTEKIRRQTDGHLFFYTLPNGAMIAINTTQANILDYFLEYKHIQDRDELCRALGISKTELNHHISCINNLTGVLPLSKVSENGISFNKFFEGTEKTGD